MKVNIMTNVIDDFIGAKLTFNLPENVSLRSLLDSLVKKFGDDVKDRLFTRGKLKSDLTILVNGHPLSNSDLEEELPQPCEISIIQMLSGG